MTTPYPPTGPLYVGGLLARLSLTLPLHPSQASAHRLPVRTLDNCPFTECALLFPHTMPICHQAFCN